MLQLRTYILILVAYLSYTYYKSANFKSLPSPIVKTSSGSLRGIVGTSRDGREFYQYLGINYAQAPVGELRFESPQPVLKHKGVFDASEFGPMCLQVNRWKGRIGGSEDCLSLNVFTPRKPKEKSKGKGLPLMPVLVWIHGGMWVSGSSAIYGPDYFADYDVVLVSINYRLGFLNTGDENARGNMALRDQVLALKWVQSNIAKFNGDPNRVTLFGESAGGASVYHHILSPLSKGLFQKAISQSAVNTAMWTTNWFNFIEQGKEYGKLLGCPTDSSKEMVSCLKKIDGTKLMDASYGHLLNPLRDPITIFTPSIEQINDEEAFLTEVPSEILRKGNFNKVPFITGVNSEEGLLISTPLIRDSLLPKVSEDFNKHTANILWRSATTGGAISEGLQKIKEFYFGDGPIDKFENYRDWTDIITDSGFGAPIQKAINLHSKHSPVYAYYYTYEGDFSLTDFIFAMTGKYSVTLDYLLYFVPRWVNKNILQVDPIHYGVCHLDELAMLFPLKDMSYIKPGDKDYKMSKMLLDSWVKFASDPVSSPPEFGGLKWPPAEPKNDTLPKYMHMNLKPAVIDEPNYERSKFWNTLNLDKIYNPKTKF